MILKSDLRVTINEAVEEYGTSANFTEELLDRLASMMMIFDDEDEDEDAEEPVTLSYDGDE